MRMIALLRGVTPTGKNRIPKMSYLAEILTDAGFKKVQTYIQSGNVLLDTDLSLKETADKIHKVIQEHIGADLAVILKTKEQLETASKENPFDGVYDFSRIHLVFTNDRIEREKLAALENTVFEGEVFRSGTECLYMFFLFFGLFHLHRIWGLIDRDSYEDFWIGVLENRGVFYYLLMGILAILCVLGIITFFRNLNRNYWWRWIYLFGGGYLLFDLFAIVTRLNFWHELLLRMFDVSAPYWNLLWGAFILLGAFVFCLGTLLLEKRVKRRNG